MKTGTLVQCGDAVGVVISDSFGCCSPDETMVVFDGTDYGCGTETTSLKDIGRYEAKPEPVKCGAGRGADACIYLTCGAKGFECERFGSMRNTLIFRNMNAKRQPTNRWPECYLPTVALATTTPPDSTPVTTAQSPADAGAITPPLNLSE